MYASPGYSGAIPHTRKMHIGRAAFAWSLSSTVEFPYFAIKFTDNVAGANCEPHSFRINSGISLGAYEMRVQATVLITFLVQVNRTFVDQPANSALVKFKHFFYLFFCREQLLCVCITSFYSTTCYADPFNVA